MDLRLLDVCINLHRTKCFLKDERISWLSHDEVCGDEFVEKTVRGFDSEIERVELTLRTFGEAHPKVVAEYLRVYRSAGVDRQNAVSDEFGFISALNYHYLNDERVIIYDALDKKLFLEDISTFRGKLFLPRLVYILTIYRAIEWLYYMSSWD
jgi:hypothetical protein